MSFCLATEPTETFGKTHFLPWHRQAKARPGQVCGKKTFTKELLIFFPIPEPERETLELTPFFESFFHFFGSDGFAAIPFIRDHFQCIGVNRDEVMSSQDYQQIRRSIWTRSVDSQQFFAQFKCRQFAGFKSLQVKFSRGNPDR